MVPVLVEAQPVAGFVELAVYTLGILGLVYTVAKLVWISGLYAVVARASVYSSVVGDHVIGFSYSIVIIGLIVLVPAIDVATLQTAAPDLLLVIATPKVETATPLNVPPPLEV